MGVRGASTALLSPGANTTVAGKAPEDYAIDMTIIRFPDAKSERRGLGYLIGRFSFKSWASGETVVPDEALPVLARESFHFTVEGPATRDLDHLLPHCRGLSGHAPEPGRRLSGAPRAAAPVGPNEPGVARHFLTTVKIADCQLGA